MAWAVGALLVVALALAHTVPDPVGVRQAQIRSLASRSRIDLAARWFADAQRRGAQGERTLVIPPDLRPPAPAIKHGGGTRKLVPLLEGVIGFLALYLFVVGGDTDYWRRRRRVRVFRSPRRTPTPDAITYLDLSRDVARERVVARTALVARCAGIVMVAPLLAEVNPRSLVCAALGTGVFACGVGIERCSRPAAIGLLICSGVVALTVVGLPAAVLAREALLPVLRGEITHEQAPPRESRYRRLFTGKRRLRVVVLLAASVLLLASGLFALWAGAALTGAGAAATRPIVAALAFAYIGLATWPYRRARRHAALHADSVAGHDARPPVLYLRSFVDDGLRVRARGSARRYSLLERLANHRHGRFEEVVAGCLWAHGPVVTVSGPGERLAPMGAARTTFDEEAWQAGVERWIAKAALIVITVGHSSGLAWEIAKVVELDLWDRTILLLPPLPTPELKARWRFVAAALADSGIDIAAEIQPAWVLTAVAGDATVVAYEGPERDEWTYEAALRACARTRLRGRPLPAPSGA